MNYNYIETRRLILRQFTDEDATALFLLLSDKEVNTFLPMFPLKNKAEARTYLYDKYINAENNGFYYAVCLKENNIPIGYVHVSNDDSYDLGYALCKEFWNNGIITEACIAVLNTLKTIIPYITATHDVNNPGSGRVMQKIGMKYRYSYKEDWQPKNILVTFRMYQLNFDGQENRIYKKYWEKSPIHFIENI